MGNRSIFLYLNLMFDRLEDRGELVGAGYGMSVQACGWLNRQIRSTYTPRREYELKLRPKEVWRRLLTGKAF